MEQPSRMEYTGLTRTLKTYSPSLVSPIQQQSGEETDMRIGVSVGLLALMGNKYMKSGKFMPAGLISVSENGIERESTDWVFG